MATCNKSNNQNRLKKKKWNHDWFHFLFYAGGNSTRLIFGCGFAEEPHGLYKVSKFVDGDTFWVRVSPEKDLKVRLIGVDTPEVKWEGLTEEQPCGKEASE